MSVQFWAILCAVQSKTPVKHMNISTWKQHPLAPSILPFRPTHTAPRRGPPVQGSAGCFVLTNFREAWLVAGTYLLTLNHACVTA